MNLLELTLPTTAENLAVDEVLLEHCDALDEPIEVLRLWENPQHAVIVGRSTKVQSEIDWAWCESQSIPIFRRSSGGTSVVIGPGCLMYSIVLDYRLHDERLRMIDHTHEFVMQRILEAVRATNAEAQFQGTCDLTIGDMKFSGNSLRCKRNCLLYHGTILYDFRLELIEHCLLDPPRQPEYRKRRSHEDFVINIATSRASLEQNLIKTWQANTTLDDWPIDEVTPLAADKYENDAWIYLR